MNAGLNPGALSLRIAEGRVILPVRVTPKGGRDCLLPAAEGDTTVKVKVSSPPEGGKANHAVIELLSDALDIPRSRIQLLRGEKSREKQFAITISGKGEAEQLSFRLSRQIGYPVRLEGE
jgi:uncharacterized protein (TIGR00251 family)